MVIFFSLKTNSRFWPLGSYPIKLGWSNLDSVASLQPGVGGVSRFQSLDRFQKATAPPTGALFEEGCITPF